MSDRYTEKFVADYFGEVLERARGYSWVANPADWAFITLVEMVAETEGVTPAELGRHTLALVKARKDAQSTPAADTTPAAAQ